MHSIRPFSTNEVSFPTSRPITNLPPSRELLLPNEIWSHIFSYLQSNPLQSYSNVNLVCKQWYVLINQQPSFVPLLNEVYGQGFPLHRQINDLFSRVFPFDRCLKIPTLDNSFEELVGARNLEDPSVLMKFLPFFEEKHAPILKGQFEDGRWFFLVRCDWHLGATAAKVRDPSLPQKGDAVIMLLQKEKGKQEWQIKQHSDPAAVPSLIPAQFDKLDVEIVKEGENLRSVKGLLKRRFLGNKEDKWMIVDWLNKIINHEEAGVLAFYNNGALKYLDNVDRLHEYQPADIISLSLTRV